jgi:hypothetical protein
VSGVVDKLAVNVSFDPRRGYFTVGSELPTVISALSLTGLKRRIEAVLMPDDHVIVLRLDALADRERNRRRRGDGDAT